MTPGRAPHKNGYRPALYKDGTFVFRRARNPLRNPPFGSVDHGTHTQRRETRPQSVVTKRPLWTPVSSSHPSLLRKRPTRRRSDRWDDLSLPADYPKAAGGKIGSRGNDRIWPQGLPQLPTAPPNRRPGARTRRMSSQWAKYAPKSSTNPDCCKSIPIYGNKVL